MPRPETLLRGRGASANAQKSGPAIPQTPEGLEKLNSLVSSIEELRRAGYVVEKLSHDELEKKKRCATCGVRSGAMASEATPNELYYSPKSKLTATATLLRHCKLPNLRFCAASFTLTWTCCGNHVSEAPCTAKEDHDVTEGSQSIQQRWQFHMTPPNKRPAHRLAVAIDCEMGTAFDGDTELIRLTLIDYFSGETLIDSLVYPDIPMKHFNTRWSGITRGDMEASRRKRLCIHGRNAARRAVFRFVGRSTIVVGHGAQSDLSALRWIHHRVVDSFIVESVRRKHNMLNWG
ncbi:hypothetical protein VTH82DRAFT_6917 [Thermothelomyces myriococcoides]